MITQKNFFDEVDKIGIEKLPYALKRSVLYIWDEVKCHRGWSRYSKDNDFKQMVDLAFEKLEEYIIAKSDNSVNGLHGTKTPDKISTAADAAKALIRSYVLRGDSASDISKSMLGSANGLFDAYVKSGKVIVTKLKGRKVNKVFNLDEVILDIMLEESSKHTAKASKPEKKSASRSKETATITYTEKLPDSLVFIRRFLAMNGKSKTKAQILSYTNALQKAILEKRIRKIDENADVIRTIQQKMVKLCNSMKASAKIVIDPSVADEYKQIVQSEQVKPSIKFLKRYINLQGKQVDSQKKKKVSKLAEEVHYGWGNGKLKINDDNLAQLTELMPGCLDIRNKPGFKKPLPVLEAELNGVAESNIMCSTDFAKMEFDSIGFDGKWLKLIGDPCKGFTAMVFGKPKMGKSYLCVDFAGYLARKLGKVLYVAKEEKLDATLQKKLNDKEVVHENLFVSDNLPADLSGYDYIFLDSVTKLGLSPEDIDRLRAANPGKTFIFIFQSTKEGNFRGDNAYQHDVDVVIEVPERGKAVQFGRFNQGGEMDIFPEAKSEQPVDPAIYGTDGLAGIVKRNAPTLKVKTNQFLKQYLASKAA